MKNPSSTQSKSTEVSSKSCHCEPDYMNGMNPVPLDPIQPAVQGFSEQPASGVTNQSIGMGNGKLNGAKG